LSPTISQLAPYLPCSGRLCEYPGSNPGEGVILGRNPRKVTNMKRNSLSLSMRWSNQPNLAREKKEKKKDENIFYFKYITFMLLERITSIQPHQAESADLKDYTESPKFGYLSMSIAAGKAWQGKL
jgi:hypothetical protein